MEEVIHRPSSLSLACETSLDQNTHAAIKWYFHPVFLLKSVFWSERERTLRWSAVVWPVSISDCGDRGQMEGEREIGEEHKGEWDREGCCEPFCWNVQRWREAICCITTTCRRERGEGGSVAPQVMISPRLDWNKCTRYSATVTSICYWTFMSRWQNGSQNSTRTHIEWKMTTSQRNVSLLKGCSFKAPEMSCFFVVSMFLRCIA